MRIRFKAVTAFLTSALICASAFAAYPDHPIKMVVAWPAGGGTDGVARLVAKVLSDKLGQPVLVDNRSGASGIVGTDYVARAAADGYTIQYTVADSHSINPHVFANVPYNAMKDFIPVAMVGSMPNALVINPKVKAQTLPELIELAKANPDKFTYSTWGVGSGGHIRTEAFSRYTGIKLVHVPYQGSGPALQAVLAGQVDLTIVPLSLAISHQRAGKVRILGVDTKERVSSATDIPTFMEQNVPLSLSFWQGVLVPAGTPKNAVDTLQRGMAAVLKDPDAVLALTKAGVTIGGAGIADITDLDSYLRSEYTRWGKVIKEAGIRVEN